MKRTKILCNRTIAKAKKAYWKHFCNNEVSESKDMHIVWKKLKIMKNGFNRPKYPIKINKKVFPTSSEKADSFANFFSLMSNTSRLSNEEKLFRINEESKEEYKDPPADNSNVINAPLTNEEFDIAMEHFSNNKTAVGMDGISYKMLSNLPTSWKSALFSFFQCSWINGGLPSDWKISVVIPILKEGKDRSCTDSYRPISLTSNVCKLYEKIIFNRLSYYCEKHKILPDNQAGFRKGRSTTEHLVNLTNNIKNQFARRKSTLATFFDVKKAYDSVWHGRLLLKLKQIGVSGHMFEFIKNFLANRVICTKVNTFYSSPKHVDMGIPQGSIIAPLLFSILICDLPSALSKTTSVVQFADDIAMWINTNMRKNTKKRISKHIETLYQIELNKLDTYMKNNGLVLSGEKTVLMLFNKGKDPSYLPKLKLGDMYLQYKDKVKFLGVFFTRKLNWKVHIEHLISKARKRLNFLKIVTSQPWGQDTKTLIHLSISLIRSKLIYGQEVYFSAPKCLLNKLQSIDSKALKIALGIPLHASTRKTYQTAGILPLDEQRKFACAKYFIKYLSLPTSNEKENILTSSTSYPLQTRNVQYIKTIADYTKEVFDECNIDISSVQQLPLVPIFPPWEIKSAKFDIDYCSETKRDDPLVIPSIVRNHLAEKYSYDLRIFTDGSVLEDDRSGFGFVIPSLDIKKSYYIGKNFLFSLVN